MKKILGICLLVSVGLFAGVGDHNITAKVTEVRVAMDHEAVYFKVEGMGGQVTNVDGNDRGITWFYFSPGTNTAGCNGTNSSKEALKNTMAALLSAKVSQQPIEFKYCLDRNGYGWLSSHLSLK